MDWLWKAWIAGMIGLMLVLLSLSGPPSTREESESFARSHYPFPPGR